MKNINSIVNVVLAVAVAILFYLHFASNKKPIVANAAKANGNKSCMIAYFEMDSIQNHFEYYKQIIDELTKKEQEAKNILAAKKNDNIAKLKEYQGRGNAMSQEQMAAASQDMQRRESDYQFQEQSEASKLSGETRDKLLDVKKKIEDFLKDYNKDKTYSFIISNSADLIYYKDSAFNITNDIVKGLNDTYKPKKK